jgi:hypothetical protein
MFYFSKQEIVLEDGPGTATLMASITRWEAPGYTGRCPTSIVRCPYMACRMTGLLPKSQEEGRTIARSPSAPSRGT